MMADISRMRDFLDCLCPSECSTLEEMRIKAEKAEIPIIRRESQSLIKTVIEIKKPEKILEIGTATGYSACFMALCSDAFIDTIEIGKADFEKANENISALGLKNRIKTHLCDASDYLSECNYTYDLIFLDAAKGQYIKWLSSIKKIMKKGSVLIADNVLLDGKVLESRFAIDRRDRTEHKRMRQFLQTVMNDEELVSCVLDCGDGMAVCVKK